MSLIRRIALVVALGAWSCLCFVRPVEAAGCDAYTGGARDELALLDSPAVSLRANENVKQAAMPLQLDQPYVLLLQPQNSVGFVVPPTRQARDASAWGGIAYFHVEATGRYRIGLDTTHSIDLIDAGDNPIDPAVARVVPPVAYEAEAGCERLQQRVRYELAGGTTYRVHFSGERLPQLRLLITRDPGEGNGK